MMISRSIIHLVEKHNAQMISQGCLDCVIPYNKNFVYEPLLYTKLSKLNVPKTEWDDLICEFITRMMVKQGKSNVITYFKPQKTKSTWENFILFPFSRFIISQTKKDFNKKLAKHQGSVLVSLDECWDDDNEFNHYQSLDDGKDFESSTLDTIEYKSGSIEEIGFESNTIDELEYERLLNKITNYLSTDVFFQRDRYTSLLLDYFAQGGEKPKEAGLPIDPKEIRLVNKRLKIAVQNITIK